MKWFRGLAALLLAIPLIAGAEEPSLRRRSVALIPFERARRETLLFIKRRLETKMPVRVTIRQPSPLPAEAFYKARNRYRADRLLTWLANRKGADIFLGVTSRDISTTLGNRYDWGIFGLGSRPGKASVISSHRLGRKGGVSALERLARIAVHEVGHNFGLEHCPRGCVMADAMGGIKFVDAYSEFCESCRVRIWAD